jgi:putative oxidoreductase
MAHGFAKLTRGPEHFADVLQKLGVPLPHLASWATILVELVGGLLVLAGALLALASVPMIFVLLVAIFSVHLPYGFSSVKLKDVTPAGPVFGMPGYEVDLLYIAAMLTLILTGPGPFAMTDAIWAGKRRRESREATARAKPDAHECSSGCECQSDGIAIRPAVSRDAAGIARRFLESAEFHAGFDERYATPDFDAIATRYRDGSQHLSARKGEAITLVAEVEREIAGFVDARLEKSCDPMHRDLTYCYIADIAVTPQLQNKGIGALLLRAAEQWGREQGAEFASLEYHTANTRAGLFYGRRMSYRVVSMFAIKRLK